MLQSNKYNNENSWNEATLKPNANIVRRMIVNSMKKG